MKCRNYPQVKATLVHHINVHQGVTNLWRFPIQGKLAGIDTQGKPKVNGFFLKSSEVFHLWPL